MLPLWCWRRETCPICKNTVLPTVHSIKSLFWVCWKNICVQTGVKEEREGREKKTEAWDEGGGKKGCEGRHKVEAVPHIWSQVSSSHQRSDVYQGCVVSACNQGQLPPQSKSIIRPGWQTTGGSSTKGFPRSLEEETGPRLQTHRGISLPGWMWV